MRLQWKLLLVMLFVVVAPVATSGISSVGLAQDEVMHATREGLTLRANHLMELAERTILDGVEGLTHGSRLDLHHLTLEERTAALALLYDESPSRTAMALVDAGTGHLVADLVFQRIGDDDRGSFGHEAFPVGAEQAFADAIPLRAAAELGRAVSAPYTRAQGLAPLLALAVAVEPPPKDEGRTPWVLAAEFSLRGLCRRFEDASVDDLRAYLVDHDGALVCGPRTPDSAVLVPLRDHPALNPLHDSRMPGTGTVEGQTSAPTRDTVVAAWARASRLGSTSGANWGVIVEQPRHVVLAPVERVLQRTGFWIVTALLMALVAAVILARGISIPIEQLTAAMERFGRGDVEFPLPQARSADEISTLSHAFHEMAQGIARRDDEIRRHTDELHLLVEERTRDLKEAQDQLIQTHKRAAAGELSATLAQELGHPLTGAIGAVQLALLRTPNEDPRRPLLLEAERDALRIRGIVEQLSRLTIAPDATSVQPVDVHQSLESALGMFAKSIISQRIHVVKEFTSHLPSISGRPSDLQQLFMQLIANARDAMPEGGTLILRTDIIEQRLLKVTVQDTGPGIAPRDRERIFDPFFTTHASRGQKGMGLTIAYRIAEEHGGRLSVDTTLGKGCAFRIILPVALEDISSSSPPAPVELS